MPIEPQSTEHPTNERAISRRGFLRGVGVAGAGTVILDHPLLQGAEAQAAEPASAPTTDASKKVLSGQVPITLTINGQQRTATVEPRVTLLDTLRNYLQPPLTGAKLVCDIGTCGACTVLLNDKPVYACLVLAIDAVGKKITTVEGLGTPDHPNAVQQAFVEKDAMMCGFCTPGFVTTVSALLATNPKPTLEQVREGCKGNFCKCGTYPHVFEAAMEAAKKMNA